jgi:hypothetical protein
MSSIRPVVLVHGAWYGGWAFRDVVKALNKRGAFNVFTPTLTGWLPFHVFGISPKDCHSRESGWAPKPSLQVSGSVRTC